MQQMTCSAAGGPATCTAVLMGNTAEEMVANGTKHVAEAHPEMAADIKSMSKEAMDEWKTGFDKTWNALPEM